MPRPSTTEVVLVGGVPERLLQELDLLPNVRAAGLTGGRADDPETRARSFTASAHGSYAVHDVDPLGGVGRAWTAYFDENTPIGTLEVEIEALIARLRAGSSMLPDYFVVVEPEALSVTERHWWLGAVADAAPSRVVPAPPSAAAIAQVLATLPAGRWWPDDLAAWLRALATVIPDRVGRV